MSDILRTLKHTPPSDISSRCIPILARGVVRGRLRPITMETVRNEAEIKLIAEWREASSDWFTTRFPLSEEGTRQWLEQQVLSTDDRILFFVEDEECTPVGQVGLLHYDENTKQCEYDNLLRGRKGKFGNLMNYALITLGIWSIEVLKVQVGYIRVVGDNHRAIRIYHSLGAEEVERSPLFKSVENGVTRWLPASLEEGCEPERELVTMRIKRESFLEILDSNHMK